MTRPEKAAVGPHRAKPIALTLDAADAPRLPIGSVPYRLTLTYAPTDALAPPPRLRLRRRTSRLAEIASLPAALVHQLVVGPQLLAAGGTCEALAWAARGESAFNLLGGVHHARRDLSHGFCLVNDVAIAIERLRAEGIYRRVLILDLDLHQGNGNATCFRGDGEVFTVSLHEQGIFPIPKAASDLGVGLAARTGDAVYLDALAVAMTDAASRFSPGILVYVAGSDPYARDPLGSLQLSRAGLLERDQRVARFARELGCPLVALPAGGYSDESPAITADGYAAMA